MGRFTPRGPPASREMWRALQPFIGVSALAGTLLIAAVGALFLVPLGYASRQGWSGGGAAPGIALAAPAALALLYLASRQGVRHQLRPLAQVCTQAQARLGGEPVVHGRLRRGWGVSVQLGEVRVVAARGRHARPDLYLVRGEREYRFHDRRNPLDELDEALRALGLAA